MDVRLAPSGEAALRLTLDDADAETAWRTVHRIADWLNDRPIESDSYKASLADLSAEGALKLSFGRKKHALVKLADEDS